MGGSPSLYLSNWKSLMNEVKVFHSDFLLVDYNYNINDLIGLKGLFAVSIKERYLYTESRIKLLWKNLKKIIESNISFYITFTGKDDFSNEIANRFGTNILKDSFVIPITKYKALQKEDKRER
jgi:hypothetical protein